MKKKIEDKKRILGDNYISVHVRRTDHVELAKKHEQYTSDETFYDFIDKFDSNMNIYIATDDEKTYYKFKEKYSNRIKFNFPEKNNKHSLRQTSLEDAIIDMYVCSFSKYYMGTKRSSFSRVIKLIKDSRI